jgi:hypothetical protein
MAYKYNNKNVPLDKVVLETCLTAIDEEGLSTNAAAVGFNLSEATVRRHRKVALRNELRGPSGAKTSLPANVEGELAALIKTSAAYWFFPRIDKAICWPVCSSEQGY